jgi:hypothetical protein
MEMNKLILGAGIIPIILMLTTQTVIADNNDYQKGYNVGNKAERTGIFPIAPAHCDMGWSSDFCAGVQKGYNDAMEAYNGSSLSFNHGFNQGLAAANITNPTLPPICQPLNSSDYCIGWMKGYSFQSVVNGH